jgi:hypothetical protein
MSEEDALRIGLLLTDIERSCRRILSRQEQDVVLAMVCMSSKIDEALHATLRLSRDLLAQTVEQQEREP